MVNSVRLRKADRTRFLFPVFLSAALFLTYALLKKHPGLIPSIPLLKIDLRDLVGKDLNLLKFAAFIPLVLLIVRAFDTLAFSVVAGRRRKTPVPQLLRDIVSLVLYVVLFGSVVTTVFPTFDPKTYFTSAAVIGAVLALALQDTLGNLFSGIALAMEDSFEVGDVMKSADHIGTVEAITWRATRIRTFDNHVVVLPNSVLARDRFEVFARTNLNARVLQVPIDYNVPPAAAIEVLAQAASHVDGVATDVPCLARVASFGDSGITYEIKYFTRNYADRDRIDAAIRRAVWYALRRNEMSLPFPIRSYQPYVPPATGKHEIDRDVILERLRSIELLSPLSDAEHQAIADAARVHFYAKGETVIRRGAAGDSMYVIARGSVSIRIPDVEATNGSQEIAQLKEGAVFGEMALLTGEKRTANVVALTDVTTIEIDKYALQPVLVDHPELAATLSHRMSQRRDELQTILAPTPEEAETTILTRIKTYFGL